MSVTGQRRITACVMRSFTPSHGPRGRGPRLEVHTLGASGHRRAGTESVLFPWLGTPYHMVVEVVYENLRGFVGGLQQAYAQYDHARRNGSGVFWQGRFTSRPAGSANRPTCTVLTHPQRHPHAGKSLSRALHACRIRRNQVRQPECLDPASRVGHREECLCGTRQLGRSGSSSA